MDLKSLIPPELQFTDEELAKADEEVRIMVLVNGLTPLGQRYWAYLATPPGKFLEFQAIDQTQTFQLDEYGEVLALGFGESPPPEVAKEMEEIYGINHNFEQELVDKMLQIEERERIMDRYIRKKKPEDEEAESQAGEQTGDDTAKPS